MKTMYKIVDWIEGPKTLFHGVGGSKLLEVGKWITAVKKMVSDGSRQQPYLSGFHVMPTLQSCIDYLQKFRNTEHKAVITCEVKGVREKPQASGPVFLADKIKILDHVWSWGDLIPEEETDED